VFLVFLRRIRFGPDSGHLAISCYCLLHGLTVSKAEAIAARLRIPFGYLFLSQLPEDDVPLPDLRTVSGERPENPSLDFIEVVQSTLLKQQWFSEYMQESHANKTPICWHS
jgi:hypothetical protein